MLSPSSRLLQKRREATEVHKAMKLQGDFESTLRAMRIRKDELIEGGQMKEYLQKFDNFLKLLGKPAERGKRELTNQKQVDMVTLQEDTKSLIKERDCLKKRVQKNGIYTLYPRYLDKVVQASEQAEARQVMSRYDTLMLTREDLVQTTQQNQDSTEKARAQLARFMEQSNDTLAQLQCQLDKARAEGIIWESRWAHIQDTAAKTTLLLGTIKMATLNLYQSVCKRAKDTRELPVAPEDTPKQQEKIQTFLADLIALWEEVSMPDQPGPTGHK
ncbi:coiled-coil domain-containing protein 42-like [Coregonus clupeaformis]|uniref:coiled-coil domain-containing protein 42-like n=1 Tax=Coregonus clupeaformis TaxID=59861 RepID=UPI001BE0B390|nr:coiled-coil domain-containing protein 42-like [Coregonus clupeaformis]